MIFISTSLFATDVSNFDIKGIKLGMDVKTALPILEKACKKQNLSVNKKYSIAKDKYGLQYDYTYNCAGENNIYPHIHIGFRAGHDKKVYKIEYSFDKDYLLSLSEIHLIINKVKKKYSNPIIIGKQKSISKKDGNQVSICWGNCKKKYVNNEYWKGENCDGSSKYLIFFINSNPYGDKEYAQIGFKLYDDYLYERQERNYNKNKQKKRQEEIEKIDL
jgi:hypothetical protein